MKKIRKYILCCICVIMVICQINNISYSYTIDEIKKMTNFQVFEGDEEPEEYDILIDANDLINNEKLPAGIKATINDVLYSEDGLFNIDFFGKKSNTKTEEENESEKSISEMVKILYKVALYISLSAMLVILVYIGILLVSSGMLDDVKFLPFSGILKSKKNQDNPEKNRVHVRLIEQWMTAVITLVVSIVVMNLSVYFSDAVTKTIEKNRVEEEKITIYVKNSEIALDAPILSGTITSSSSSTSNSSTVASSGEASALRQKVVDQAKTLESFGVVGGFCEMWVENVYEHALGRDITNQCCAHDAALNAINTSTTEDNIVPGAAVFSYRSSNPKSKCTTCGKNAGHVGIYIGDGKIASCTGHGDTGIVICTIEEWKQSWDFSCWGWLPRNRRFIRWCSWRWKICTN